MSIIGLMVYDELQKKYTPLGSGKKTFEQLTDCIESETNKTYTLNSLGLQAANSGALQTLDEAKDRKNTRESTHLRYINIAARQNNGS